MTEKRRATTFRTSRGAIVNVAAPQIYLPPGITEDQVREALREELDIHSSITDFKVRRVGVDSLFDGVYQDNLAAVHDIKPSTFWRNTAWGLGSAGEMTCPAAYNAVEVETKRAYRYGYMTVRTVLPTLNLVPGGPQQETAFGFEGGASAGNCVAMFHQWNVGGVETFSASVGAMFGGGVFDITSALPADIHTVPHIFSVILTKMGAEFYIDRYLVCVAINSPNLNFTDVAYPPLGIFKPLLSSTFAPVAPAMAAVLAYGGSTLTLPLSQEFFRVSDGDPTPPRVYRLYDAGTMNLFAGLVIAAGSETSHPVPIFGYDQKTFYFRANQNGTLLLEVLTETDNWRTYNTASSDQAVTANELYSFLMYGRGVLARVTFTPDAYPCTISEAEVVMT